MKKFVVGCDISKRTIDFSLFHGFEEIQHFKKDNKKKDLKMLIGQLDFLCKNINPDSGFSRLTFVMEHTGIYSEKLIAILQEKNINFSIVHAMKIKQAAGMDREKMTS